MQPKPARRSCLSAAFSCPQETRKPLRFFTLPTVCPGALGTVFRCPHPARKRLVPWASSVYQRGSRARCHVVNGELLHSACPRGTIDCHRGGGGGRCSHYSAPENSGRTGHDAPRTVDMLALSACLLSAIVPVGIDLATLTPDQADRLRTVVVELRPTLGPRIGTFGGKTGYDHRSMDGRCRTVWVPTGTKVEDVVLVGRVEVIDHQPAGMFPGFVEVRFRGGPVVSVVPYVRIDPRFQGLHKRNASRTISERCIFRWTRAGIKA